MYLYVCVWKLCRREAREYGSRLKTEPVWASEASCLCIQGRLLLGFHIAEQIDEV